MSGLNGPTFRMGGRVDHNANGFDPGLTVRDFDYGHTSVGADGRTVREWEVVARGSGDRGRTGHPVQRVDLQRPDSRPHAPVHRG